MRFDLILQSLKATARHWLARWLAHPRSRLGATLPSPADIRAITVLKLDRIGDFILSTGALHALGAEIPEARCTLVVRSPIGELARQQFPAWNVVELPPRENALRNLLAHRAHERLKALSRADVMVDMRAYRDYSDSVIASWVPATFKLGLINAFEGSFSDFRLPDEASIYDELTPREPPHTDECADIAGQRGLVHRITQRDLPTRPKLSVSENALHQVQEILSAKFGIVLGSAYILVFPGTSSPTKEIPSSQLARGILDGLSEVSHIPLLICGSRSDSRTTVPLLTELSKTRQAHDATGLFSLSENIALIAGAQLLVGMDSCHIHIAGALDVPAIGILGGAQFGDFAPWGESARFRWVYHRMECYGCQWVCPFPQPNCLHDIPPSTIAQAIREVLIASA